MEISAAKLGNLLPSHACTLLPHYVVNKDEYILPRIALYCKLCIDLVVSRKRWCYFAL